MSAAYQERRSVLAAIESHLLGTGASAGADDLPPRATTTRPATQKPAAQRAHRPLSRPPPGPLDSRA